MIRIIKAEKEWKEVLQSLKHDFYHTWDYHHLAQNNGEGEPIMFYLNNGQDSCALPLLLRTIKGSLSDATSVYGYPGILSSENFPITLLNKFFQELVEWSNNNSIISIFSRLNTCVETELKANFPFIESNGETVIVDLTLPLDEQRKCYRKNYRNLINKLNKDGYRCSWSNSDEDKAEFIEIYNETMKSLDAHDYYFFNNDYYDALFNAEDFEVRIYNCYFNGVKVCSGLFVFCDDIVQYHLSGTVSKYKRIAPTRLMIDTVRKDATELGYRVFHLGGGTTGSRDSLFDFKFGFSKTSIDFKVLKLITNRDMYAELANISVNEIDSQRESFFPLYRKR